MVRGKGRRRKIRGSICARERQHMNLKWEMPHVTRTSEGVFGGSRVTKGENAGVRG